MGFDYFSGIRFSLGGSNPSHSVWHRHVPTYYGVQYNHAGTLRLRVGRSVDVAMEGPCAFISHPGAFFEYGTADGRPRHHNFVCFFGPKVQDFIKGGLMDIGGERPLVRISRPLGFLQTISELGRSIDGRAGDRLSHGRMALMLEDLLLQIQEAASGKAGDASGGDSRLLELISRLERDPAKSYDFQSEARRASVTLAHLRRLFKRHVGAPPQQHLTKLRLRLAAEMLAGSSEPLSAIGEKCGIGAEYYFSRLFKRRYSISPSKYRREFSFHPVSPETEKAAR